MVAASSIGPGATNMVTRRRGPFEPLPCCCSPATPSSTACRIPVLQQVEHFNNPSISVTTPSAAVTRYWTASSKPEQLMALAAQAVARC